MINKVSIKNFQSHESTKLLFTPGVNVIVGESDSGKSAIIRALRWAVWNQPRGDAFRSDWGGKTSVRINMDEGFVIRGRTDTDNYYKIKGVDVFRAIKNDVPQEVAELLRFSDVNLQQQFDSSYLLSNTAGEVAAHFNSIADLEQIDIGTRNVKRKIKSIEQDITIEKQLQEKNKVAIEQLSYLEELEELISSTEAAEEAFEARDKDIIQLSTGKIVLIALEARIKLIEDITQLQDSINVVNASITNNCNKDEEIELLREDIIRVKKIEQAFLEIKNIPQLSTQIQLVLDLDKKADEVDADYDTLNDHLTEWAGNERQLDRWAKRLKLAEKEFHAKFPDVCPLCMQKVKK